MRLGARATGKSLEKANKHKLIFLNIPERIECKLSNILKNVILLSQADVFHWFINDYLIDLVIAIQLHRDEINGGAYPEINK